MSLDYPTGQIAAIQRNLNIKLETINGRTNYTEQARRAEKAKAVLDAKRQVAELKDAHTADRTRRQDSALRSLFGIAGEATPDQLAIMRDSRDRAATISTEDEAATKLQLANQAGDHFMAKAIAQVARNKGWSDVIDTFMQSAPLGTRTALEELNNIPSNSTATKLADQAVFRVREPSEFLGYNTAVLERIADDDERGAQFIASQDRNFAPAEA